jgi:hypothetical protein
MMTGMINHIVNIYLVGIMNELCPRDVGINVLAPVKAASSIGSA